MVGEIWSVAAFTRKLSTLSQHNFKCILSANNPYLQPEG